MPPPVPPYAYSGGGSHQQPNARLPGSHYTPIAPSPGRCTVPPSGLYQIQAPLSTHYAPASSQLSAYGSSERRPGQVTFVQEQDGTRKVQGATGGGKLSQGPRRVQTTSDNKRITRLWELDDVYPLRLVRALQKLAGTRLVSRAGKLIFNVVHINSLVVPGPVVEIIGAFTNVYAANARAMDFWEKKYGTKMFTERQAGAKSKASSVKARDRHDDGSKQKVHKQRPAIG
ncbi:hypothetical protein GGR57DRAFT_1178 [Xylariaceae sp. FL1272]|nr:hypothetical protein GGR57DRAFT_1178 [Xylariaceae sp. FL1272]